jgi:hypothetical protein
VSSGTADVVARSNSVVLDSGTWVIRIHEQHDRLASNTRGDTFLNAFLQTSFVSYLVVINP